MLTTLGQVAQDAGGELVDADPRAPVGGVSIDSRTVRPGELFLAVPGEHADGHDFAQAAQSAGAAGVMAAKQVTGPHIRVPDTVAGLGRWATAHRARLGARVVAITGSAGKTTTKDLLGVVLRALGPTIAPPGSYNNDLGLPLTVLSADGTTRYLVLEMGARARGDVARLCAIAAPQIGVVLNVGSAHLGEFGSPQATAAAKGELVEAASELAVLNAADPLVAGMARRSHVPVLRFAGAGDVLAEHPETGPDGRARFTLANAGESAQVRLRLVGAHQISNALAAAAVGLYEGLAVDHVAALLSAAEPASRWRMEVTARTDGVVVVNDAYNANPESVRSALDALIAMRSSGDTWAVLGPMLELGDAAEEQHLAIGRYAAGLGVDHVLSVGAASIAKGAGGIAVADVEEAATLLRDDVRAGDVVLVKGSRAAGLERVALALLDNSPVTRRRGDTS